MALIDLKTDLKSLKYGHDTPGGGNSGQPYIQTAIPESRTTPFTSGLIKSSLTDTKRIFKFLKDAPQGPLFIVKQVGLQLSNPRLEVKKINTIGGFFNSLISGDLGSLTGGLLQPTRLYNLGINTLAQIPVSGFGGHLNRHGLLPVQDDNTKYLAVAQANNEDSKTNRLVGYKTKFKLGDGKSENIKNEPLSKLLGFISKFLPIKFAPKNLTIDNYLGGPGSSFGIGTTLIRRYDNTETRDGNKQVPQERGKINYNGLLGVSNQYFTSTAIDNPLAGFNEALGYEEFSSTTSKPEVEIFPIQNQTAVSYTQNIPAGANGTNNSPTLRKYEKLRETVDKQSSISQAYYNGSISGSVVTGSFTSVDITKKGLNRSATDWKYLGGKNKMDDAFAREDYKLLTVVFSAIDSKSITDKFERWAFSAYMKGFKDTFNGTWNDVNYVGRSETFYIYNKFKREVSFNLDIPCFNHNELLSKHRALGQLASTTAGSYNDNVMSGVFLKVNIGNYLPGEYAILNSLSYDIPDDSSWDLDEKLAMYIKASFSLTIVPNKRRPEYSPSTSANTTTGFFGHLDKPVKGFLIDEKIIDKFNNK
jgi:hypothetical protein